MLKPLKKIVSITAYYFGLWEAAFHLYRIVEKRPILAVFTFHRIIPGPPDEKYLQGYERGVSLAAYERQIHHITRYFKVIDLQLFSDIVTGRKQPEDTRPLALLTFDDADMDHPGLAFAELVEHGLSGVSFVPTAFIGTEKRFYHLRLTNICNNYTDEQWREALRDEIPHDVQEVLLQYAPHIRDHRRELRKKLIGPFEKIPPAQRDSLLDQWEEKIDCSYTLGIKSMTWEDVSALPARGIAVGSHTVNHNRLPMLTKTEVIYELAKSKTVLEEKLGFPVTTICYPEGSFDETTLQACEETGYELGFTTESGLVDYPLEGRNRFVISRIGVAGGPDHRGAYSIGAVVLKHFAKNLLRRWKSDGRAAKN